jgi:hypothetical protein
MAFADYNTIEETLKDSELLDKDELLIGKYILKKKPNNIRVISSGTSIPVKRVREVMDTLDWYVKGEIQPNLKNKNLPSYEPCGSYDAGDKLNFNGFGAGEVSKIISPRLIEVELYNGEIKHFIQRGEPEDPNRKSKGNNVIYE